VGPDAAVCKRDGLSGSLLNVRDGRRSWMGGGRVVVVVVGGGRLGETPVKTNAG
jgi:hypothetical protein